MQVQIQMRAEITQHKLVWIMIVILFIGIISLEFIFLGGLEALIDIFQNIIYYTTKLISWIQEVFSFG